MFNIIRGGGGGGGAITYKRPVLVSKGKTNIQRRLAPHHCPHLADPVQLQKDVCNHNPVPLRKPINTRERKTDEVK